MVRDDDEFVVLVVRSVKDGDTETIEGLERLINP